MKRATAVRTAVSAPPHLILRHGGPTGCLQHFALMAFAQLTQVRDSVPRTRKHTSEEEHTHLAIKVEHCEARVETRIESGIYQPQYAWDLDDDAPLCRTTI